LAEASLSEAPAHGVHWDREHGQAGPGGDLAVEIRLPSRIAERAKDLVARLDEQFERYESR